MILFVLFLLCVVTVFQVSYKEGLEEDYMAIVIRSIETTLKDERISESQKIALEDALSYAKHIKNI